jgi:major facilitator 4 family protein
LKKLLLLSFIVMVFSSQAIWVTFSPVVTYVSEDLGVPVSFVGYLAVTYPLFFLILTLPSGNFLDRNFRFWFAFGMVLTFLAGVLRIAGYREYIWLLVSQLFGAVGQPFLLNAFVPFASHFFEERRALIVSILSLSMYLGTVFSLSIGVELYEIGGILYLVLPSAFISVAGILMFVAGAGALKIMYAGRTGEIAGSSEATGTAEISIRRVAGQRDLWLIGIILGLGVAVFDNLATWLQPALQDVNLHEVAGDAVALSIILGLVGVAIIPNQISKLNFRSRYIKSVIPLIALFFTLFMLKPSETLLFVSLSLAGFLMLPAYPVIMDWIGTFHRKELHGSSTGFVGLVSRTISVVMMFVAPYFIHSTRVYFLFLTSAVVVAFAFALVLPDDRKMAKLG